MTSNYFTDAQTQWLMQKLGKISSSNCHFLFTGSRNKKDLFGEGAITYIQGLVDEMTTGEPSEEMDFKQTEWGKANEMDAIGSFEAITGLHVVYHGITNPKFFPYGDFAGGSPDGDVIEKSEDAICECKCHWDGTIHMKKLLIKSVEEFEQKFWKEYCQDQMNMRVTGKTNCYSISYDPRKKDARLQTKIIRIPINEEWQKDFDIRLDAAINMMADILSDSDKYLFVK